MFYLLIWALIIFFAIWNEVKKQRRKQQMQGLAQQKVRQQYQQGQPGMQQRAAQYQQQVAGMQQRAGQYQQQGQPGKQQRAAQQYQQSVPQQRSAQRQSFASQNMEQMQTAMTRKQQELKARLQKQYGTPKKSDILSRAAANVQENRKDELETGIISEGSTNGFFEEINAWDALAKLDRSSDVMREVNDLMIMGYQTDMTFERDFLAEGIELISGYEVKTESQAS